MNEKWISIGLAVAAALTLSAPAHAYLDAGSGSMLLQAAISGFLGLVFVGRTFLSQLRRPKAQPVRQRTTDS